MARSVTEHNPIREPRRGNRLGIWYFRMLMALFGLRAAYVWLYPVCLYYLLFDRKGVRCAMAYVRRRFPARAPAARWLDVYRLFLSQGRMLVDRYAMAVQPDGFDFRIHGYETIRESVIERPGGFILLTSHVGNWQAVLGAMARIERPVCLLMRAEDNRAVARTFDVARALPNARVVSPEQPLSAVLEMVKLLSEGYLVSIMGDRAYDFQAAEVTFLGDTARLPCGPYSLAAAAGCPVVVLFASSPAYRRYDVHVAGVLHPRYVPGTPKRDQLRQWTQAYADMLAAYLRDHPYQCHLFHDVWAKPATKEKTPT
jgi:predicted LPLAT superfamily acyltransferase